MGSVATTVNPPRSSAARTSHFCVRYEFWLPCIQALAGFRAASGFIRKTVSTNLRMRHAPEFDFAYDSSIEQGAAVLKLIEQVTGNT